MMTGGICTLSSTCQVHFEFLVATMAPEGAPLLEPSLHRVVHGKSLALTCAIACVLVPLA